jgi:hypothetical protein
MEEQMWRFEMQKTDSKEEEYSVTFTQIRECLIKSNVDLSLLTHPPTPHASLPLTLIKGESDERDGMISRIQMTPEGIGGQHSVQTGRGGEFSLNGTLQHHAV